MFVDGSRWGHGDWPWGMRSSHVAVSYDATATSTTAYYGNTSEHFPRPGTVVGGFYERVLGYTVILL